MDYKDFSGFINNNNISIEYCGLVPNYGVDGSFDCYAHAFRAKTPDETLYDYLLLRVKDKFNLTKEIADWGDRLSGYLNAIS